MNIDSQEITSSSKSEGSEKEVILDHFSKKTMVIFTFIIKKAKKQMSSISTKQSKETRGERSAMVRTWNDRSIQCWRKYKLVQL